MFQNLPELGKANLPSHVYVPGKSARHPEGLFDAQRNTAKMGMSVAELADCDAFLIGQAYIEKGYYWEAHELLEAVWLALPKESEERRMVQALIQYANARLKLLMGQPNATRRLCAILRDMSATFVKDNVMGVGVAGLRAAVDSVEARL